MINTFKYFCKNSVVDVWEGPKYVSGYISEHFWTTNLETAVSQKSLHVYFLSKFRIILYRKIPQN